MITKAIHPVLLVVVVVATFLSSSHAFPATAATARRSVVPSVMSSWRMSADISDTTDESSDSRRLGATERLLLMAKFQRENGFRQDYGVTIKKDGWDGVRAVVWAVFYASQVIFPILAVALTLGLLLNVLGYGYYLDGHGSLIVDSLEHIRLEQQQLLVPMETTAATTLTVETVQQTWM
jgi:hypothetical protein